MTIKEALDSFDIKEIVYYEGTNQHMVSDRQLVTNPELLQRTGKVIYQSRGNGVNGYRTEGLIFVLDNRL